MLKILTNNCDRKTIRYIPARDLWTNRFCFSLSNESKHWWLTIDCRKANPAKYRTNTNSNLEQIFYFGQNKKDRLFSKVLAERVDRGNNSLIFQTDSVINVIKNGETKIYKAVEELESLMKYNNGKEGNSDRQQPAVKSKFADRKYFGRGSKIERRPKFLS